MRRSIHFRVLVPVLLAVVVVGLVTAVMSYRRAVHEIDELFDAQLAQQVHLMLALVHDLDDDEATPPHIHGHKYEHQLLFQIWRVDDGQGKLLIRSPGSSLAWPDGVAHDGYSEARIDGRAWRAFAATDDHGIELAWAALDLEFRDHLAAEIARDNMLPYLVGMPILLLVLWLAIRQGLMPLRRLETELASRSGERLDALPEDGLPRELTPLVRTLNRLFGRVGQTLDNERRFTSDAAHELRTPLAALRMQLQVAQRTPDEGERRGALDKALRGADRMGHLVTQLLALARLESNGGVGEMRPVDLSALAGEVVADLAAMATGKGVVLELDAAATAEVRGNPDLIRVLLRNLVDNAVRYARTDGHVAVSVTAQAGQPILRVADDGPGVAAWEREKLGQRFHRFGPQSAEGVGLGLSIVRRIAELHAAELHFGDGLAGAGLLVEVRFPRRS
ncbi:MAG: ATP-binding protein [Gallionellaceae bacterium]|nr:ATP-binding protein [Gallionellaceae bacterium]